MKSTRRTGTIRTLIKGGVCLLLCLVLGGCHHRRAAATLPPVLKAPDAQPPTPTPPSMQNPPPDSIATAPPVKVTQSKPKRAPKRGAPKTAPPETTLPDAANSTPPTAEGSIGELSTGSEARPQAQQAAAELIATCEQRITTSPENTADQQASLRKVRYFLKQAKDALSTGDAEGAMTLATKAKVLLDDLAKETS